MSKRLLAGVIAGLAASLSLATAVRAATTVTFADIDVAPAPYGHFTNNFFDGGLHFTDQDFSVIPGGTLDLPTNAVSQFLEVGSSAGVADPLAVMLDDGGHGGAFSLLSFKMGLGDWNTTLGTDTVTITGHKAADCVVDCTDPAPLTLTVGYAFATYRLTGFTGLSSISIGQQMSGVGDQRAADLGWLAFDDVTYAPGIVTAAIPEPASWSLMIAGFAGVGAMIRRGRRSPARAPTA